MSPALLADSCPAEPPGKRRPRDARNCPKFLAGETKLKPTREEAAHPPAQLREPATLPFMSSHPPKLQALSQPH